MIEPLESRILLSITVNGTDTSDATTGATSLTWSDTVAAGTNRAMFVELAIAGLGASVTGVTYGGVALTQVGREAGNQAVEIWDLVNPTVGTANIVVSLNATSAMAAGAVTFNGVDQTAPTGTFAGASGTSTAMSVAVSSFTGDMVIDSELWNGNPSGYTIGGGQTQQWTQTNTSLRGVSTTATGAASVTMSSSVSTSSNWEIGAVSVHGLPVATKLAYVQQPSNVTAGVANSPSITVDVDDQFGNIVTTDSSNVTLAVATGPGSASGTLTVAASSGVATFSNVKINTAGNYTLTASDGALTTATSSSFTVNPAAASKLAYSVQPSNVTAGVADSPSIVVDVEDQFGNIVTTDSSNVTLAVATGPGSASGTLTVAASSGVATFSNVKLNTAGNYTLTASDGALTTATSSSFTVSAAAASKLAYGVQPSNVTAGVADSPSIVVDVEDQFGNIVTGNSSNVTLAVATGPGSASGTLTVAASSGVATFSNVKLNTAGNYTLTASDGALTTATSSSFTVSAAAASKLAYGVQPSNVTAGVADSPSIVVDVEDQFGNIVTTDSSNVTLSVATGPGSASGTLTVAAVNGVATFSNVKINTAGSYTLTASDGALTTATSSSFAVNPAAASKLAYSVQPSNVTAGVADSPSIVVDVEDQFGNIVTGNSSNVTLSVATGPGSASGTLTVAAVNGVATFSNVKINTAGSYTLTASDGALTTATSSSFAVNPAAASKLAYSVQPSNVTAGVADSPSIVVDVEDQFGNIVTGNSSNVTLAVASGPGSASGTLTVAASSGVATFSNVKLNTAGNYTLTASDGALTTATSSSFTVSAAAASKLAYSVQPSNVTAGVADSPSIVVDVEDQFGNIVTTDSSNVTLAVATGPGSASGTLTVAASGGIATFSNVKINTAGSYTLTASDGALTTATSSSFTVSAAAASKLAYGVQPSNVTAGVADSPSIVVDVEDQFGNIVTTDSSNVTLSVATGPGSLSGTVTVAASSGVATFSNVKLNTAGNYTLTASDGALTTATSSSFTVSAAAASKLAYGVQPSNVTAGVADSPSIVVDVEDQFGNIVTTDSSNVTLSVATGPGSLSGTVTVAASSGVATFSNVKLNTAGNYTLTASDGALTTATSSSFTVSAAAASKLAYGVQPSNVTAGVADSPSIVVDVEDQFGNIVTTDSSNVTLAVATGPGSASGTLTVAASSGVATFSNVKLNTAGNYTLTASDGALTTATSGSFTVSVAAASKVVYSVQPSNVTAGVADSPSIVVDVEDQFGNIVTTDSSNVTLSVATGSGSLSGTVTVAASSGVATFSNVKLNTAGNYTLTASDGALTTATSGSFTVSAAAASKLVYSVQPSNVTAGVADSPSIVVDVEDQFGNIVTSDGSNVTLSVATGPGSLSGTVTVAASSGVATFSNVKIDTAGNYTLTASDGALTTATSGSFTVSAAAASKLAYSVQPSNVTAGVADSPSIVVDVEDQFGNIITSDGSNVTLAVATGPGSASGTLTVAASSGVATFNNVKINAAGNYTLTASDGALTTATSSGFTVNPAAASQVVYAVQPSNVTAGVADSPSIVVDVEDQFGNIVTSDGSNVTLSVATGPGSLSGTVTVAASSGVATFSNVKIDTAGNYTLTASDGALTTATSGSFTVSAAAASKLAYGVQPSNVTAGVADSPSIVVDVEDQFGNIVTTDSSNVTLAVATGPGSASGTLTVAASSGVATFSNVKLNTAGNYTLTASDGALTTATSGSFTVSVAAASKVVYSVQPSNVTAGVADSPSIVVDVEDQFGNIVTTDSSNVTLAVATGPGSASGTVTVAASGGVATLSNVKLNTAGNYTLTASDGALTTATSSSFTVNPAAASKLAYSVQPSNVTAGVADSPSIVVDVEDQFGNIVSTDSSNVTLAVASGPGSASGTLTVAASGGVATFSNVKLDTAGNYTLTASDGALTTATSSSFTVSPAAASQVVYAVQPSNVTAGVADSPSIVVDVEDQFGNIVSTDSSNVTLAVATGPGSASGTLTVAASSGVATFSNVKLDTSGNYTLTASDGSLTSATSNSFTVSAAAASKVIYAVQPSNVTAGVADSPSIVVDVEDQFGNIVTTDSSNVTLSVASGPGSLSGTVTVAASGGVATFSNVKLNTAGNYTLTASDGALTTATSGSFTVNPAAASKVVYAVQPSNVTAGVADSPSIVVDVEDQFGNIITSDGSNVTLSVATGPGSLSGTLTVAASGGIATFSNIILDTAGNYTLTASDGALTTATSSSFTVSAAAASKLAYSVQPSNVTAGVADSPSIVVDVEDQFGNVVTTDSSNVTLAVATGPGSASGTLTVAAVSGVATFSNVKINTAGNYTLTASDGALTTATSGSFTVSAAAASKLAYGVQPSNVTAGVADSPSIVVDVEDQFGNIVTTDSSNVTLAVATGPGSASGTLTVAASSGVATFSNVKLNTAGNYTLTASDGALTTATSGSFTVSVAAASKVVYSVQPSNVTAGVADSPSIVVDVEDQFGNIVTTDSSNVTLAVATGPGSASGTLTVAASGGVATFSNVKLNTAGNYTLTASDGALTTATSSSFTVNAAAASQVVYAVQPSNVTAGVADSPSIVVDVEDQFGNIVTTDSSNVTLAVATGPGSASGTLTVAASSGIATFSNIILDTAGNYTLTASDGALTTATSGSFTVSVAAASKVVYAVQPSNVTAGVADSPSIVVDVEDQFGNIVTTDSSNVTLAVATGPGSATGTLTVAASSGVATFSNVKLDTAGNYTLTASDGALTTATSSSFTVSPAAASQVVYAVQPSNVTAGVADSPSIVVDVEDQFGNIVTTDSSNVTLSVATGPGSLTGTLTVAASSGVATFSNVKLNTAGNYTLTAGDGALTTATSSSFTVSPAAASQVVYAVQPSNVTAGVADSPSIVVDVEDEFGNIVTTDSSNVTLSVATGPGSLTGTVTVAASSGVATFSNVKLDTAGNYTLSASDGSLTSATSNSFTVSAAAASKVVYAVQPSNVTAGVADSPSIVVDVEDPFGNIVTTDSSNVTLAVASGPGSLTGTVTVAASGGVATFSNIILDTSGNYTLTASDGSLTSATSNSFTVSAAAASKVIYAVQPSNVTAGVADSPSIVVDVDDQFGNIVTTDSSNVTLSVATGPGSLTGTVTVAASSGVATFSNIILDTSGNYTLTASDGSLTSATSNSFTVNPTSASKVVYAVQPSNVTAGVADSPSIVVDVEDPFGNIVTTDSSNVTLAVASGPGSLTGTVTVAASSGIATFGNIILNTAGNYTLTASDGSLTSATSNSFTVSAAASSKVAYSVQPSNVTAGVADSPSIVVGVEDQFGNIVTTDSSNVTLSVATGPGSLTGTVTVAASSGIATFGNIILNTAGNYTLTASDGALTTATSSSFTVSPAAASQVVYAVQPSNVTAGVADSPSIVVDVEDQFGNLVTTDSSNVTLAVASGPGSASGTLTVAASSGVATFSNVKLNTAGNYTLTASDGALTTATSGSFTVSAAAASKVIYAVQPSNVTAGVADSPSIVVDVEDQFGNIVSTDSSNVTLAVATGPGKRQRHVDGGRQQRRGHLQQREARHRRHLHIDRQRRSFNNRDLQQFYRNR